MIKEISVKKFKKLENVDIKFERINLIVGKNATGKSSILHIVSNSYQKIPAASSLYKENFDKKVSKLSSDYNLKFEKLTKGDRKNNDPAPGTSTYYSCTYEDNLKLDFRKHVHKDKHRFSVKPKYTSGAKQSLPNAKTIFLSLQRVTPIGEIFDEDTLSKINLLEAEEWIAKRYYDITDIRLTNISLQKFKGHKSKIAFETDKEGVDSNTISAGQDSLLAIISALYVLKYNNDMLKEKEICRNILLIDEFDITLHPEFQFKLMDLLDTECKKNNIQCFLTSHSFEAIKYSFDLKWNVLYLQNHPQKTLIMQDANILKIKADLENTTKKKLISNQKIPYFIEDNEANLFFEKILEFTAKTDSNEILLKDNLHKVDGSFPCEVIKSIFIGDKIIKKNIRSIGILDADQNINVKDSLNNGILVLPGNKSPEDLVFDLLDDIVENTDNHATFYNYDDVRDEGYTYDYLIRTNNEVKKKLNKLESLDSKKGERRKINKEIWNANLGLIEFLVGYWIEVNKNEAYKFSEKLRIIYNNTTDYYDLEKLPYKNKKI